jgi:hypothetical protein
MTWMSADCHRDTETVGEKGKSGKRETCFIRRLRRGPQIFKSGNFIGVNPRNLRMQTPREPKAERTLRLLQNPAAAEAGRLNILQALSQPMSGEVLSINTGPARGGIFSP